MNDVPQDVKFLYKNHRSIWWKSECLENRWWRWASNFSALRIVNPEVHTIHLTITCNNYCQRIDVRADGVLVVSFDCGAGEHRLSVPVRNVQEVEFEAPTWVPIKVNPGIDDKRDLSFQVWSVETETAAGTRKWNIEEIEMMYELSSLVNVQQKDIEFQPVPKKVIGVEAPRISKPYKHGYVLHLHKPCPRILNQLKEYSPGKNVQGVIFTDHPAVTTKGVIHVDPLGGPMPTFYGKVYAVIKVAIQIAKEKGWDYFTWLEWDDYFGQDNWLDTIWGEVMAWPYEPIQAGTPVISWQGLKGNFLGEVQQYASEYIKASGVAMHYILNLPFFVSVNGSLATYKTSELYEYFFTLPPYERCRSFDVQIGLRMLEKYGEDFLKYVAWVPSMYSGWGDEIYTIEQRLEMVHKGHKVAMHQYKME